MSRITVQDAKGWVRTSKFTIGDLETELLEQIEEEVLSRLASAYAVSTWIDASTTPRLVRVIIAKMYVAYTYQKAYSEDEDSMPAYARSLLNNANDLMTGILDGTITLSDGAASALDAERDPAFYPNDLSSSLCPGDFGDDSLGDAKFSMGRVF